MEALPAPERLPPYELLVDEDVVGADDAARPPPAARRSSTLIFGGVKSEVMLNSSGQHTISWDTTLRAEGVAVEPASLNLYTYPGPYKGAQLALIHSLVLKLAQTSIHLFEMPDPVGAYVIHALIVCNTDASLELAFDILERAHPRLLLQTHRGEPFNGEGCLHIVCANRREEHGLRMIELATRHFTPQETRAFLSTQALGVFFNDPPMCWYGDSPLAYACVFGLRRLVRSMLDTGHVTLSDQ